MTHAKAWSAIPPRPKVRGFSLFLDEIAQPISIPDVVEQFWEYLQLPDNGAWGSLHSVLDDGNVSNHDVKFCRDWAREHADVQGERLAEILLLISRTQRLKLPHRVDQWDQKVKEGINLSKP